MDCRLVVLAHKRIQFRKVYVTDKKRPSRLLLLPRRSAIAVPTKQVSLAMSRRDIAFRQSIHCLVILHVVLHSFRQSYNDCIITYAFHLRKQKNVKNTKSQKLPIMAAFDPVILRAHSPAHLCRMCTCILRTFLCRRTYHIFRIRTVDPVTKSFF